MRKVQWNVRFDYEYLPNYKLLQKGFLSMGISKVIEVERLMKGKYQDNLEFCQFLMYLHAKGVTPDGRPYDPIARRSISGCLCFPDWAPTAISSPSSARPSNLPSTQPSSADLENRPLYINSPTAALQAAEKERDIYFSKLERIEKLLESDSVDIREEIKLILYSVNELVEYHPTN